MAPMFGHPNYDFLVEDSTQSEEFIDKREDDNDNGLTQLTLWYLVVLMSMLLVWLLVYFCLRMVALRQKTRNPQRRRMYRADPLSRHSVSQQEPTIYVSPSNLPPPPKYEALAPPSYDEVVGIHYPNYQSVHVQPITQPITIALAQTSNATANEVTTNSAEVVVPTPSVSLPETAPVSTVTVTAPVSTVTVTNERRTSINA